MYDGHPNQGMRNIQELLDAFSTSLDYTIFDVRGANQFPSDPLAFDMFISTGGPGSPHDGDGEWDRNWFQLLQTLWDHNAAARRTGAPRKFVLLICHSFQMACRHFGVGEVSKRKSTSFGVMPVHLTLEGRHDPVFECLPDPFHVVDSRDWQVVKPNDARLAELGAEILALEKIRDHVPFERAVMAIRFSEEIIGTQFHPEAEATGMMTYFSQPEKRQAVIAAHGELKYLSMLDALDDEDKIPLTQDTIIPTFLEMGIQALLLQKA
ncbi:MAG: GMP synthase [Hymenobacteraceae bacterium]|nr:GMP synthase [Hymenobacteraceae bacterium]